MQRTDRRWSFPELRVHDVSEDHIIPMSAIPPVAKAEQLHAQARLYLVALGSSAQNRGRWPRRLSARCIRHSGRVLANFSTACGGLRREAPSVGGRKCSPRHGETVPRHCARPGEPDHRHRRWRPLSAPAKPTSSRCEPPSSNSTPAFSRTIERVGSRPRAPDTNG